MLPVVRGEDETRLQILLYSALLYAVTQLPFCVGVFGGVYLVASMALGLAFIGGAVLALSPRRPAHGAAPVSVLDAVPGAAVRGHGARRQAVSADSGTYGEDHSDPCNHYDLGPAMDRKLARKNLRSGLSAAAACLFMFGITFVAAAIYVHS